MTNPTNLARALARLLALMRDPDAEFPDMAWRVANAEQVDYVALCDAYDALEA